MLIWYVATLIYAVSSIAVLARGYFERQLRIPVYLSLYALFVIFTVLTNFSLTEEPWSKGVIKYLYANQLISSLLALFIVSNIHLTLSQLKKVIHAMTVVVVLASLVSIIQFFYPDFLFNRTEAYQYIEFKYSNRIWSLYSWTLFVDIGFSYLSYISIIFGVGLLVSRRKYVMLLMGFLISLLNGSRWVILNAIVISFQDFLSDRNRFARLLKFAVYAFSGIILITICLFLIGVDLNALIFDRLFQEESASTRLLALEVFLDQFPQAPLLGTGGVYTQETLDLIDGRSSQIHVGYLAVFYLYGLIGGILFLGFLYAILRKFWTVAKKTRYWGSYYCFLGFALANLTLVSFELYYHGLLLAVVVHNFFERNSHLNFQKVKRKRNPSQGPTLQFKDFRSGKGFRQVIENLSREMLSAGIVMEEKDIEDLYRQIANSEAARTVHLRKQNSPIRNKNGAEQYEKIYSQFLAKKLAKSQLELKVKEKSSLQGYGPPGLSRLNDREVFREWAIDEQRRAEADEKSDEAALNDIFEIQKVIYDPEFFSKKVIDTRDKKTKVLRLIPSDKISHWDVRSRFFQVYEKELSYYGELTEIEDSFNGWYYLRPYIEAISLEDYLIKVGIAGKKHLHELKESDQELIFFILKDLFNISILHGEMTTKNTLIKNLNPWSLDRNVEVVLTGFTSRYISGREMDETIHQVAIDAFGEELYEGILKRFEF